MAAPRCPARPHFVPGTLTLRSGSRPAPGTGSGLREGVVMWPGGWAAPAWTELGRDGDAGLGQGQPAVHPQVRRNGPTAWEWRRGRLRARRGGVWEAAD